MPVVYPNNVKAARMVATRDEIDAGGAAGKLEIGTAGMAGVLAVFELGYSGNDTGTVSGTTLTFAGFPKNVAAIGAGTAASARFRTSADADVVTGLTVGLSTDDPVPDIIVDNVNIAVDQNVVLASAAIQHA